jgi:hypothetical protein
MRRFTRIMATALLVSVGAQLACGTILYPERRGQRAGRIDPAVAIMDGIGVLFFVIPGLAAFAVDFATGAIYLPGGRRSEVETLRFDGASLRDAIDAVERHEGIDLDAHLGELRVYPLDNAQEARARVAALGGAFTGTLALR